jgi:hypothetical protein
MTGWVPLFDNGFPFDYLDLPGALTRTRIYNFF